jgi:hypothetical protein
VIGLLPNKRLSGLEFVPVAITFEKTQKSHLQAGFDIFEDQGAIQTVISASCCPNDIHICRPSVKDSIRSV